MSDKYGHFILVSSFTGLLFVGETQDPLDSPILTLSTVAAINLNQQGMQLAPPIFPCEKMLVRPAFIIYLKDLRKPIGPTLMQAMHQYELQLKTGLVLAKS